ncbi:MAG: anti-sigma factor [Candidatus Krumholzibacteriia bacterium]
MRCERIETLLDAYVDHETSAGETAALETHLQECPTCRRELESRRELRRLFSGRRKVAAPTGLQDRIVAAVAEGEDGDRTERRAGNLASRRWRRARWPLALAAAAVLAFAVVLPSLRRQEGVDAVAPAFTTPSRVVVPRYGEKAGQDTPVKFGGIDLGRNS